MYLCIHFPWFGTSYKHDLIWFKLCCLVDLNGSITPNGTVNQAFKPGIGCFSQI